MNFIGHLFQAFYNNTFVTVYKELGDIELEDNFVLQAEYLGKPINEPERIRCTDVKSSGLSVSEYVAELYDIEHFDYCQTSALKQYLEHIGIAELVEG